MDQEEAGTLRIVVERRYEAPAEEVFDAWLDPETASGWLYATDEGEMERVEIDGRVGGGFRIEERRGEELASHVGEYVEIERPRRLVFTFATTPDEDPSRVTVELEPDDEGCTLTLTHEIDAEWAEYEDRTREGWTTILEGLAEHVEGATVTRPEVTETSLKVSRVIQAPRQAVYEALTDPSSRHAKHFVPNQAPGMPMDLVFDRSEPAREGGPYRVTMTAEEGPAKGQHTAYGEFLELVPHERIVETHHWEGDPDHGETRVTITLEEAPGGTRVTILHEGLPSRESAEGHAEGFAESLANLAAAMEG